MPYLGAFGRGERLHSVVLYSGGPFMQNITLYGWRGPVLGRSLNTGVPSLPLEAVPLTYKPQDVSQCWAHSQQLHPNSPLHLLT